MALAESSTLPFTVERSLLLQCAHCCFAVTKTLAPHASPSHLPLSPKTYGRESWMIRSCESCSLPPAPVFRVLGSCSFSITSDHALIRHSEAFGKTRDYLRHCHSYCNLLPFSLQFLLYLISVGDRARGGLLTSYLELEPRGTKMPITLS